MISVVAALTLSFLSPLQDSPRLRTLLPNGASIIAEQMPNSSTVAISLFSSARGISDKIGQRHLLEHLILDRKKGNQTLDEYAESQGIIFTGRTSRDTLQIEVIAPAEKLSVAIELLKATVAPLQVSSETISKEAHLISEEIALSTDDKLLSDAVWRAAYGEGGIDPAGQPEELANVSPQSLEDTLSDILRAERITVSLVTPLPPEKATEPIRDWISGLKTGDPIVHTPREFKPDRYVTEATFGEARGAKVGAWNEPETAEVLAAAMALASQRPGCFLTFTPGLEPGLIVIGRTSANSGFGTGIDGLEEGELAAWFEIGKSQAKRWVQVQMFSANGLAGLRGRLLNVNVGLRPETMLENLDSVDWNGFRRGVERFRSKSCAVAVGVRR